MKKPNRTRELRRSRKHWRRHLRAKFAKKIESARRHDEGWNKTIGAVEKRRRRRLGLPRIKGANR